jgi:hypothetical protein
MNIKKTCLLLLIGIHAFSPVLFSQDPVSLPDPLVSGGIEYAKPVYQEHDSVWLKFIHEVGMARVKIESLSPEVKSLLGYDARLASEQNAVEASRKAEQARIAKAAAADAARRFEPLHGVAVKKDSKGIVIETLRPTGETRSVSEWSNNNNRLESREEEVYIKIHYLVWGIPNAEYIKEGAKFAIEVLPEKKGYIEGSPVIIAKYIRHLE